MSAFNQVNASNRTTYDSANRRSVYLEELVGLLRYRYLVAQLVARNIKTRYKRSFLGVTWTMVNPLLTMVVLTLVFSQIFGYGTQNYALHVLSGLIIWNFFAQSTVSAMSDLMWSGGLIGRIYLPKSAFAVSAVGTGLLNLLLALIPYLLISLALGVPIRTVWWALPLVVIVNTTFTLGIGLLASSLSVYFQDVMPMYEVLLTAWMYLTPVIYPVEVLPTGLRSALRFNPMVAHVEAFRSVLLRGELPSLEIWVIATGTSVAALGLGWWAFARRSRDYAYRI